MFWALGTVPRNGNANVWVQDPEGVHCRLTWTQTSHNLPSSATATKGLLAAKAECSPCGHVGTRVKRRTVGGDRHPLQSWRCIDGQELGSVF